MSAVNAEQNPSRGIIASLQVIQPQIRVNGLRLAVRNEICAEPRVHECASGFLPDGYLVLPEVKELHLIEVVDTCPITFDKAELIWHLSDSLDEFYWDLSVVVYDYGGGLAGHYSGRAFRPSMLKRGKNLRDCIPAVAAAQRECGFVPTALPDIWPDSV